MRVLKKKTVERPPVICPGGMMNAAVVEIMKKTGHTLPEAHHTGGQMSLLAADVQQYTGFENFGVPFCMTVEAEALGSGVNFGSLSCEPKIEQEAYSSLADIHFYAPGTMAKSSRVGAIAEAIHTLSRKYPDIPVIGSITGPISTTASLVDPMTFLKTLHRDRENSHRVIDYVCGHLIEYASILTEAGASAISIADPTSTGEILGPKLFEEYTVRYINKLVDSIHRLNIPVIVHICGKMEAVKPQIGMLDGNAVSVDAMVSLKDLKHVNPSLTVMGNVSTIALEFSQPDKIRAMTERLLHDHTDIIAPACGLSTSTPLANINALTGTVIHEQGNQ